MIKKKLTYKVIDNLLHNNLFLDIKNYLLSSTFSWTFHDYVSNPENKVEKNESKKSYYFIHSFYTNYGSCSEHINILNPLLEYIKPKALIMIKANLYPSLNKIIEHGSHVDQNFKHNGFIYYLNTNNGYTKLSDGTKIESIENRGLFFDSSLPHQSTNCTDQNIRINLNFNYF